MVWLLLLRRQQKNGTCAGEGVLNGALAEIGVLLNAGNRNIFVMSPTMHFFA